MTDKTITPEQHRAAIELAEGSTRPYDRYAEAIGITIAPPQPSPEMVKLAREIVAGLLLEAGAQDVQHIINGERDDSATHKAALAALQHVERVVKDAPGDGVYIVRPAILTAIGSNRAALNGGDNER